MSILVLVGPQCLVIQRFAIPFISPVLLNLVMRMRSWMMGERSSGVIDWLIAVRRQSTYR